MKIQKRTGGPSRETNISDMHVVSYVKEGTHMKSVILQGGEHTVTLTGGEVIELVRFHTTHKDGTTWAVDKIEGDKIMTAEAVMKKNENK